MTLDDILADPPKVHDWGMPDLIHSGLSAAAYGRIVDRIGPGVRTLETGMGISTVVFAWKRADHVCIAPDPAEYERLRRHCGGKGVPLDTVRFEIDRSEKVLAARDFGPLDLVLIDGCHGFPVAFFDFFYLSAMLKVGGVLVIDDIQVWTGKVVTAFLREEPEWDLDVVYEGKTAFFTKTAPYDPGKEWDKQPYVIRHSARPPRFRRLRRAVGYALRGDFKTLWEKVRKNTGGGS